MEQEDVRSIMCEEESDGKMSCTIAHGNSYDTYEVNNVDSIAVTDASSVDWRAGTTRMEGRGQLNYHPDGPTDCIIRDDEMSSTISC